MLRAKYLGQQMIPNFILVSSAWAYTWYLAPSSSTTNEYQNNKHNNLKIYNKDQKHLNILNIISMKHVLYSVVAS